MTGTLINVIVITPAKEIKVLSHEDFEDLACNLLKLSLVISWISYKSDYIYVLSVF
jgi:hypothetical protein